MSAAEIVAVALYAIGVWCLVLAFRHGGLRLRGTELLIVLLWPAIPVLCAYAALREAADEQAAE